MSYQTECGCQFFIYGLQVCSSNIWRANEFKWAELYVTDVLADVSLRNLVIWAPGGSIMADGVHGEAFTHLHYIAHNGLCFVDS